MYQCHYIKSASALKSPFLCRLSTSRQERVLGGVVCQVKGLRVVKKPILEIQIQSQSSVPFFQLDNFSAYGGRISKVTSCRVEKLKSREYHTILSLLSTRSPLGHPLVVYVRAL